MQLEEGTEGGSERVRVNGALGFGSSFAGGMALFGLGGHWLDTKFDKEPLFTLLGIALGFIYGGWELWKLVARSNQRIAEDEQQKMDAHEPEQ